MLPLNDVQFSKRLVLLEKALDYNGTWRQVAAQFDLKPGRDFCEERASSSLLVALDERCDLEQLKQALLALDLQEECSYLCDPEDMSIVKQPYFIPNQDCSWENGILYVRCGGTLHLKIEATGTPLPSFQWFNDNIALGTGPELVISSFSKEHQGLYHCTLQQVKSSRITSDDLSVKILPEAPQILNAHPSTTCSLEPGKELFASVEVLAYPEPSFEWWCINSEKKLSKLSSHSVSEDGNRFTSILRVTNLRSENDGDYFCHIRNSVGQVDQRFSFELRESTPLPTEKKALILANAAYQGSLELFSPVHDAFLLKECLGKYGFECTINANCTKQRMKEELRDFCNKLKNGAYVLFCFAGHGFTCMDYKYMMGTDATNADLPASPENVLSENDVIAEIQQHRPALLITILDMCQLHVEKFYPEHSHLKMEGSLIKCYSTSMNRKALESKGPVSHSLYMTHLCEVLERSGEEKAFYDIISEANERVRKEGQGQDPGVYEKGGRYCKLSDPIRTA